MSASKTYVVDFQNKSEHVIKSKCFSEVFFFDIFSLSLTHKEEKVWPDGNHPMLFIVKLCLYAKVLGQ